MNSETPTPKPLTHNHWLQQALKQQVAPALVVDGKCGKATTAALKLFQAGAGLVADGKSGPRTIAALEQKTGTRAPPRRVVSSTPLPVASESPPGGHLTVTPAVHRKVPGYRVSDGKDSVTFAYFTPKVNKYRDPCCMGGRYLGATTKIDHNDFVRAGYGPSEEKIFKANSGKEAGGKFGIINSWDDQLISWGICQFAGVAGTLASLMSTLKADKRCASAFQRLFVDNGIDVEKGKHRARAATETAGVGGGKHLVVRVAGRELRGDDALEHIRTDPRLLGAFMLAGNDAEVQRVQLAYWLKQFLRKSYRCRVGYQKGVRNGRPIGDYLTTERGRAVIARVHNGRPANVRKWGTAALAELKKRFDRNVYDPKTWDGKLEAAFIELISKARKDHSGKSYDKFATDLDTRRGSFKGAPAAK